MKSLFEYIFFRTFMFYQKHNDSMSFFMALLVIVILQIFPIICLFVLFIQFDLFPSVDSFYFSIILFILLETIDKCHFLQNKQKIMHKFSNKSKYKHLHLYSIIYLICVISLFFGTAYLSYLQKQ